VNPTSLEAAARELWRRGCPTRERGIPDFADAPSRERFLADARAALTAALPHLTPSVVPHVAVAELHDTADWLWERWQPNWHCCAPCRGREEVITDLRARADRWLRARADRLDPKET
jgi:hypothetical protein